MPYTHCSRYTSAAPSPGKSCQLCSGVCVGGWWWCVCVCVGGWVWGAGGGEGGIGRGSARGVRRPAGASDGTGGKHGAALQLQ